MKPKIKEIRENNDLSQEEMAVKMGISQSAYARFELSKTKIDLNRVELFAKSLSMSVIDVLTFPNRFIDVRDIGKEMGNVGPEVTLQIKIKDKVKEDVLKMIFGNKDIEILK